MRKLLTAVMVIMLAGCSAQPVTKAEPKSDIKIASVIGNVVGVTKMKSMEEKKNQIKELQSRLPGKIKLTDEVRNQIKRGD